MAVVSTNQAAPSGLFLAGLFTRLDVLVTRIAQARATTREVEHLSALSDAQLAEKGLSRDEVVHYAARAYL